MCHCSRLPHSLRVDHFHQQDGLELYRKYNDSCNIKETTKVPKARIIDSKGNIVSNLTPLKNIGMHDSFLIVSCRELIQTCTFQYVLNAGLMYKNYIMYYSRCLNSLNEKSSHIIWTYLWIHSVVTNKKNM